MTRATLGLPRLASRFTIERLRTVLLIGGGLLVVAIAVFLTVGQWKLRKAIKDIPGRLGIDVGQSADGVNYTQTRKGKTIFKIHAAKAVTRKTGGTTILHDVKIDLYGEDGNRADTITGSEFEYDPAAGIATAAGPVEILMMRPGVKPAISSLKPDFAKSAAGRSAPGKQDGAKDRQLAASPVLGAITDDEIHIRTSGLTFNQKTGVATTGQRVDFALKQGSGNAVGATYDSPNGHLVLGHSVELTVERSATGPITVQASHAEFDHQAMQCQMTEARANYTGGTVGAEHALMHFREDGSVSQVDGSEGVDLRTASGSHVTAPTGTVSFDAANHPRNGLLQGGTRLEMNQPNRQVEGSSPTARLTFNAQGELTLAHLEQGVVFNSRQQVTTAKGEEAQVRRTWNSSSADVTFAPAAHPAKSVTGEPDGHVEPRKIQGYGGTVVTSQTVAGDVAMPSRFAAETVTAELAPGGALSTLHGVGHASFDERTATGLHRSTSADLLDARFVQLPEAGATPAVPKAKDSTSEIASVVELGHVVLVQDAPPPLHDSQKKSRPEARSNLAAAPAQIRATANRADYDGSTEVLHLTGSPRVSDGGMEMTANALDFVRASGDGFAHGDVRASWSGQTPSSSASSSLAGSSLLATGSSPGPGDSGGNGPLHAIAAEAELHQASQEVVFKGAGKAGMPRLWQSVNSVSAPQIKLNRLKETLDAVAGGAEEPVRTVLTGNGPQRAEVRDLSAGQGSSKTAAPSVIRIKSGTLHYSEAERIALFQGGVLKQVTAVTTDPGGSSTITSDQAEVKLFPAGTPGRGQQPGIGAGKERIASPAVATRDQPATDSTNSSIDRLIASGHVAIDWPGRRGSGEQLVYRSEDGNYTLTGTAAAPPRVTDEARGTVTGSALILHSGDDRVTVEGDGGKTRTETRSKK